MMQPSKSLLRQDATRGYSPTSPVGCSLPQSNVRAVLLIVTNVFREQTFEMPFTHGNNLVQEISSAAFDPTLRHAVLPRTSKGGPYGAHLQGSKGRRDFHPYFASRSQIRNLGADSNGNASRNC